MSKRKKEAGCAASADRDITPEEFKDFVCAKAYDVISEGRYRKFLLRSKDAGDDWAVSVYDSVHRVQALLKAFHHAIGGPAGGAKPSAVHALCSDVVGSSSAPVQTRDGLCTCAITAARANGCIEIVARASGRQADSRPKRQRKEDTQRPADGSLEDHTAFLSGLRQYTDPCRKDDANTVSSAAGSPCASEASVCVHPMFSYFFLMVWYVGRIEHVVRNYTRCWLDRADLAGRDGSVQDMCEEFARQRAINEMYTVFADGYRHVMRSVLSLDE